MGYFTFIGILAFIFSLSLAFWAVTYTMKTSNDQGDSTGDRFYYVVDYQDVVQRDKVSKNFAMNQFDVLDPQD